MSTIMTPLRNPEKKKNSSTQTFLAARNVHPTLTHEVVMHSSKRRNETRKEDTETGALKMKLRKERGGQKTINDFALGGEGREKGRGTRDDCI
jgi:hypothetical protein